MSNRLVKLIASSAWVLLALASAPLPSLFGAATEAQKNAQLFQELRAHFTQWDTNHDGTLSADEIDVLINDPNISGKTAAVVSVLKAIERNKKKWNIDSFSAESLQSYAQSGPSANPDAPNFGRMYSESLEQISKANRSLFAEGPPSLQTCHQGRLGDCYFLAPLGAAVNRDGKAVGDLIVSKADGSYEVNFAYGHQMHVPRLTDAEIALTTSSHRGGLWLNVLENAYSTVRYNSTPDRRKSDAIIDMVARGGSPGPVLKLFTGHGVAHIEIRSKGHKDTPPSDENVQALLPKLRTAIAAAVDERRLICCGTPKVHSVPAITPSHVYAILNFHKNTDVVEVWNPHGNHFQPKGSPGLENGYPTEGGRFSVPLPEFAKIFGAVVFEVDKDKDEPEEPLASDLK